MNITYTTHKGQRVAAHVEGQHEQRVDRRRSKDHVTNVRRQQREAKRALEALFV